MPVNNILDGLWRKDHYIHNAVLAFSCGEELSHPHEGCRTETPDPHPFSSVSREKILGWCRAYSNIHRGACSDCIWKGLECSVRAPAARERNTAGERELSIKRGKDDFDWGMMFCLGLMLVCVWAFLRSSSRD